MRRALVKVQDLELPIGRRVWAHLARLHRQHGRETVVAAWRQVTGAPAPDEFLSKLDRLAADLDEQTPEKAPS